MCLDFFLRKDRKKKKKDRKRLGSLSDSIYSFWILSALWTNHFANRCIRFIIKIRLKRTIRLHSLILTRQPVINDSDQHLLNSKLAVTKMDPNKLHLSFRHFRCYQKRANSWRSTYRLGEFRATCIFGKHHIDSTVRQSHAKINEISRITLDSHSWNGRRVPYHLQGPRWVVFPRLSV